MNKLSETSKQTLKALMPALRSASWHRNKDVFHVDIKHHLVTFEKEAIGSDDEYRIRLTVDGVQIATATRVGDSIRGVADLTALWEHAVSSWSTSVGQTAAEAVAAAGENGGLARMAISVLRAGGRLELEELPGSSDDASHHVTIDGLKLGVLREVSTGYQWVAFGSEGYPTDYNTAVTGLYSFITWQLVQVACAQSGER